MNGETIHFWISVALSRSLFLHLVTHWQWVVTMVSKKLFRAVAARNSYIKAAVVTVAVLLMVFTLFAWVAFTQVDQITSPLPEICPTDSQQLSSSRITIHETPMQGEKIDFWKDVYPIFKAIAFHAMVPENSLVAFVQT